MDPGATLGRSCTLTRDAGPLTLACAGEDMRTASQCRAMARSCLADSARANDFKFRTALENAAKDWTVLAAIVEIREDRERVDRAKG